MLSSMEELTRNKEQELVMFCIYDALIYAGMNEEFSLEDTMSSVFAMDFEDISYYSKAIVIKTLSHINEIKQIFQEKMPKWSFDRLNVVEQSILLMSYTHFHEEKVDKKIVIDIAVRLAKKYLDAGDYKFVNAILDNIL